MEFGIAVFTGYPLTPARLAREVEARGFESLFWAEHTHIPVDTVRADGRPASGFAHTYDPFIALAHAAAATDRLKLGTGVCLVTERDPILTAKEVASLDHMSGGRFLFGVGAGWNRQELANHGTDPRTRMRLLAERVAAMRAIWTADEAEYHGDLVDFDPLWSWPKPATRPHPPVLVGGNGPGTEDRVLEYGDGWLPQCAPFASAGEMRDRIAALRRRAEDLGRGYVPVTMWGVPTQRELIEQIAEAGVDRCLFPVRGDDEKELMAHLDGATAIL